MSGDIPVFALYSSDVTDVHLNAYKKACPIVHRRQMDFSDLPEFVKDLSNYRFKFPMVNKMLYEFEAVLYVDASIIFKPPVSGNNLNNVINSVLTDFKRTGFRTFHRTFHSNFPVTHEAMYGFFNVTSNDMKITKQLSSGVYAVANTLQGRNVFESLVQCAIEPNCMAPSGAIVACDVELIVRNYTAVHCHRFDQSAMNMRLIELYGTNSNDYYSPSDMFVIRRAESVQNITKHQLLCETHVENV
uniref:ODV-EC43 n=1 Tax=Panagrellus redivivus TaxID=6233 RepID=A0A7E4VAF3_PANRE